MRGFSLGKSWIRGLIQDTNISALGYFYEQGKRIS